MSLLNMRILKVLLKAVVYIITASIGDDDDDDVEKEV